MTKNILILFSDAGGGHRSAGEAITEALVAQHGAEARVKMVDGLKQYAPYPFNRLPGWYPGFSRHRLIWKYGYHITDGGRRSRLIATLTWPYVRHGILQIIRDNPADVYVAVHWIFLTPLLSALGAHHPPVITVVTDLVSIHGWWCHPKGDLCIVPTEPARKRVIRNGVPAEKVRVVGLPVASRFYTPGSDKTTLRAKLGWGAGRPVVLVAGGGEGMGPIFEMAQAISASGLGCELVVVTGRNQALRQKLQAAEWKVPTHIYGFVTNMPDFMRAADILVTKAGPGTLCEAFNSALPIILYDYLPGQEDGNVDYVVNAGAGLWAPTPKSLVEGLRGWIGPEADSQALAQAAQNAQKLARPEAAQRIAELIWQSC